MVKRFIDSALRVHKTATFGVTWTFGVTNFYENAQPRHWGGGYSSNSQARGEPLRVELPAAPAL